MFKKGTAISQNPIATRTTYYIIPIFPRDEGYLSMLSHRVLERYFQTKGISFEKTQCVKPGFRIAVSDGDDGDASGKFSKVAGAFTAI